MAQKLFEEMILGGKKIQIEIANLSIDDLELDPSNPRIQYRLSLQKDGTSLDDVILAMPEVKALRKDIEGNGGLRERPYVQLNPKTQKYKVIEGNCRVVCLRSLHQEFTTIESWTTVPVRIFPADLTERLIAIFLSDQHVSGKIQWQAHEQAGQIYRMKHNHDLSVSEIARYLRVNAAKVEQLFNAYHFMMERFIKIDDGKYAAEGERKFSYFKLLYSTSSLRERVEKDDSFAIDFCRWVGDNRFTAQQISKLPLILDHPDASKAWYGGATFAEAIKIVEDDDPEVRADPIYKHLAQVRKDCLDLSRDQMRGLASDPNGLSLFLQARDELSETISTIASHRMKEAAE